MQEFQTNFRQVLGSLPPSIKYLPIVFPKSTSKYENLWLCLRLHLHNFYGLILFPELPRCVQITECLAMSFIIISNLQTVLARANIFAKLTQTCVKMSIHQILLRCHTATIHTTHTFFLIYWMDIAFFRRQFLAAQNDALAPFHSSMHLLSIIVQDFIHTNTTAQCSMLLISMGRILTWPQASLISI